MELYLKIIGVITLIGTVVAVFFTHHNKLSHGIRDVKDMVKDLDHRSQMEIKDINYKMCEIEKKFDKKIDHIEIKIDSIIESIEKIEELLKNK